MFSQRSKKYYREDISLIPQSDHRIHFRGGARGEMNLVKASNCDCCLSEMNSRCESRQVATANLHPAAKLVEHLVMRNSLPNQMSNSNGMNYSMRIDGSITDKPAKYVL